MPSTAAVDARDSQLRLVFADKVVSIRLATAATFGEIARTLGKFSRRRYGNAVAIDVILGRSPLDGERG